MPQQRLVAERRWRLGVQSRGHPSAIIAELLRALRASQVGLTVLVPQHTFRKPSLDGVLLVKISVIGDMESLAESSLKAITFGVSAASQVTMPVLMSCSMPSVV